MQIEGKRRYALYLHNAGDRDVTINLKFMVNGAIVYETDFQNAQPGEPTF